MENVHVHAISVGHLRLDCQKSDDVAVFDNHSWKHGVEEGFDEFVSVVSGEGWQCVIELFEIRFTNFKVTRVVETHHLGSFLVEGTRAVGIDEIVPHFFFDLGIGSSCFTRQSQHVCNI